MAEKKAATKAEATAEAEKKTVASAAEKSATKKAAPAKTSATDKKASAEKATAADKASAKKPASEEKAASAKKAAATKTAAAKTTAAKTTAAKTTAEKTSAAKTAAAKDAAAKTTSKTAAAKTAATKAAKAKSAEPVKASVAKAAVSEKAAPAEKATATEKAATAEKAGTAKKATAAKKTAPAKKSTAAKTATAKAADTAKKGADAKEATPAPKATASKKAEPEKASQVAAPQAVQEEKAAAAKAEPAAVEPKPEAEKPVAKSDAAQKEEPKPEPAKAQPEVQVEEPKGEVAPEEQAKAEEPAPEAAEAPEAVEVKAEQAKLEFSDVPGVLIAAAECAPFVKVGGLADVVGALPKYLKQLGVDARVIMPFHRQIKERFGDKTQHMCDYQASLGWRSQYVGLEKLDYDGVTYYFIDNEFYFGGPIYCGGEFEGEQYAFFTRAVMDLIPQLDYDVKILHCNDWHTAMMPLLAKTQYHGGMQEGLRTLLTIHNLHFQGQFSHEFDRDLLRVDDSLATPQFVEHYGCDNMLKAGIVFSDKVNTVSPTYSREICEPYLGESLDGVLRSRGGDLWGILNGIDTDTWNPQTDVHIPAHFSVDDLSGKRQVRDALLEELGLEPAGENTAVISMVGRLTPQKGIDLVNWAVNEIMGEDVRFIILGSGYAEFENYLREAEWRHKGRLCSYIGYNAELSHRIYAGSDLFLMPSLYEPCGISQMIAMRYGTLPIVRETGGLRDTVIPYNEFTGEGNGFSFANYDVGEMLDIIRYALWVWRGEDARTRLVKQAMESDFSFGRCARTYAELYRAL